MRMTGRSANLIAIVFLWVLSGCYAEKSVSGRPVSRDMADVLVRYRVNRWELNVSGLPECKKEELPPQSGDEVEIFRLPERRGVADAFTYRIVLDMRTRRYWVIRSGGFRATLDVYGPGEIN